MEQNTRVFYGANDLEYPPQEDGYIEEPTQEAGSYEDGFMGYEVEGEPIEDEDYEIYEEEPEVSTGHRFRTAMNVFDSMSVLAGVVVILVLTALIVSLVTWLRTDIMHSFVILQSRIQ